MDLKFDYQFVYYKSYKFILQAIKFISILYHKNNVVVAQILQIEDYRHFEHYRYLNTL